MFARITKNKHIILCSEIKIYTDEMCILSLENNEITIHIIDVSEAMSICAWDIQRNLLGQNVIICDSFLRQVALKYNIETKNFFPFWGKKVELEEIKMLNTDRKYKFKLEKKQ